MGNYFFKQTVTTNELKAELELYEVKKVAVNGVYETFDINSNCGVFLCFKETTTPGVWKLTGTEQIFALTMNDIPNFKNIYDMLSNTENKLLSIFKNTETITLPVQN